MATGVALQGNGKIVAVGPPPPTGGSPSPATTRRRLDPSFSGDGSRRPTSAGHRPGDWGGDPGRRQDRRGRRHHAGSDFALARYNPNGSLDTSFSGDGKQTTDFGGSDEATGVALQGDGKIVAVGHRARPTTTSPRPLQPERLARHELLRRRQADDRLRGPGTATGVAIQADGKIVAVGRRGHGRLRARPLQPERLARHELLRRRQADDRLRAPTGRPGGAPGRRQDRRGRRRAARQTSRSPATTPTDRSTRASPGTAADDRLRGPDQRRVALQGDGKYRGGG